MSRARIFRSPAAASRRWAADLSQNTIRLTIPTPPDFSFIQTMEAHGWRRLLPFSWNDEDGTLSRVERLSDGRVVELTMAAADGAVIVDIAGDLPDDHTALAAEITASVRRMLQLDLPIDAFHAYCAENETLKRIPEKRQGRLLRSPTVWEDVVKVIATTNTTWTMTCAMVQRITDAFGSALPSAPTRHAFPTPAQVAAVPLEEFHITARVGYRTNAIHGLAKAIVAGEIDLEEFCDLSIAATDLRKRLLALRGVGPYAASCLMIYLGRYDQVNVDSWARTLVGGELGRRVSDKEAHAFFEPYGEWRALVYHFYPWRAGEG